MAIEIARNKSQKTSTYDDLLRPVTYGVLPDQRNDEISFVDLFSSLESQWKLIVATVIGGTLLAAALALALPSVYLPYLKVSMPSTGSIAALTTTSILLGGEDSFPSSQQTVFTDYFNLLRSRDVLAEYIYESNYLEELYPGAVENKSILLAALTKGLKFDIEEPLPEKKGKYVANPRRVAVSLEVENEAIGVELLNDYVRYANQKLVVRLQSDAGEIINHKIEVLTKQVDRLRDQYRQDRILTIEKIEQKNIKEVALLQEQISASLGKAKANRVTQIVNAREALEMAKSLDIIYPTTLTAMAQKGQRAKSVGTAITVVDKQASSLYLQGAKYLSTLIETLTNRGSDEKHLVGINNLREKIHIIENDKELEALKKRQSDDPWIEDLPRKIAEISALKALNPDFTDVKAFNMDESAVVSNQKVKPKRKLIVGLGFVLSLFVALFVALLVASLKERKKEASNIQNIPD